MSKNKQNEFIEPIKIPLGGWWQGMSEIYSYCGLLPTISESKQKKEKLQGFPAVFYRSYRECPETGRLSLSVLFLNCLMKSRIRKRTGHLVYLDNKLSEAISEGTSYLIKDPTESFNRYNDYNFHERNHSETRIEALARAIEYSNSAKAKDKSYYYFKSKMTRIEGAYIGKIRSPYYSLYLRRLLKSGVFQVQKPGIENIVRFLNLNLKSTKYENIVKKLATVFYDVMGKSSEFINTHEIELLTSTPGTLIACKPLSPL